MRVVAEVPLGGTCPVSGCRESQGGSAYIKQSCSLSQGPHSGGCGAREQGLQATTLALPGPDSACPALPLLQSMPNPRPLLPSETLKPRPLLRASGSCSDFSGGGTGGLFPGPPRSLQGACPGFCPKLPSSREPGSFSPSQSPCPWPWSITAEDVPGRGLLALSLGKASSSGCHRALSASSPPPSHDQSSPPPISLPTLWGGSWQRRLHIP